MGSRFYQEGASGKIGDVREDRNRCLGYAALTREKPQMEFGSESGSRSSVARMYNSDMEHFEIRVEPPPAASGSYNGHVAAKTSNVAALPVQG